MKSETELSLFLRIFPTYSSTFYGIYISKLIRLVRMSSDAIVFNVPNEILTAK